MDTNQSTVAPRLSFLPLQDSGTGMQVHEVQFDGQSFAVPFKSSYFTVQPDSETPVDFHSVHEMWMVAQGQGELLHDDKIFTIKPLDVFYLKPPKPHKARNTGREPLVIFSVWWK